MATNIYGSLFSNQTSLRPELQAEFDALTNQLESKVAAMTDDEKATEFDRIMGRDLVGKLTNLLAIDDPTNYDSVESACESITDEFDDLTIEQHTDICDAVTDWWESAN